MDRPLVSFLIPTRNQTVMLRDSIGSIGRLASGRHDYEILLAVDSDDVDTLAIIPELRDFLPPNTLKVAITAPKGYARLHEYYNMLAQLSSGELLMLWNDDAKMESLTWDTYLHADYHDHHCFMLIPQEIHWDNKVLLSGGFPIVTRKYYELLGAFSHSPLSDRYIQDVVGRFAGDTQHYGMTSLVISHDNNHSTHSVVATPLLAIHDDPEGDIQKHIQADREALSMFTPNTAA